MKITYRTLSNGKHIFNFYYDGKEWIEDYYQVDESEKSGLCHVHRAHHGAHKNMVEEFIEKLVGAGFKEL